MQLNAHSQFESNGERFILRSVTGGAYDPDTGTVADDTNSDQIVYGRRVEPNVAVSLQGGLTASEEFIDVSARAHNSPDPVTPKEGQFLIGEDGTKRSIIHVQSRRFQGQPYAHRCRTKGAE